MIEASLGVERYVKSELEKDLVVVVVVVVVVLAVAGLKPVDVPGFGCVALEQLVQQLEGTEFVGLVELADVVVVEL